MDASYKFTGGLINGLTGLPSGTDSTGTNKNIAPEIQAIIAARRNKNKDNTPKVNILDDIKAAMANKNAVSDAKKRQDSLSKTFDHQAYEKYLDSIGMQIVPKNK